MKKWILRLCSSQVALASSLCAVACSSLTVDNSWDAQLQNAAQAANRGTEVDDAYYQGAVTAIGKKDYALALDYLQAAKAANPQDVRVLNALGVVYDKLGRFDLSAVYYAQAHGLDPQSPIVASNIRYSRALQGMMAEPSQVAQVDPPVGIGSDEADQRKPALSAPDWIAPQTVSALSFPQLGTLTIPTTSRSEEIRTVAAGTTLVPQEASVSDARPASADGTASLQVAAAPPVRVAPHDAQIAGKSLAGAARREQSMPDSASNSFSLFDEFRTFIASLFDGSDRTKLAAEQSSNDKPQRVVAKSAPLHGTQSGGSEGPQQTVEPPRVEQPGLPTPMFAAGSLDLAGLRFPTLAPADDGAARDVGQILRRPVKLSTSSSAGMPRLRLDPSVSQAAVLLTGSPLEIVNASGQQKVTHQIRRQLADLDWTVSERDVLALRTQENSVVRYPRANSVVALGLAHTVAFPVQLELNTCNCGAIQLVIGSDFLNWNAGGQTSNPLRKPLKLATVQTSRPNGDR